MKDRRLLFGFLLIVLIASFFLREAIERTVIVPLLYAWWLLGLLYRSFPQAFLWGALVFVAAYSAVRVLNPRVQLARAKMDAPAPTHGAVEDLALWIVKNRRGNYYKWLVANRLGKLTRELLAQRDGLQNPKAFGPLQGRGWNPPKDIYAYLDSGLNGSFAGQQKPNPLEKNPRDVIAYLESEMENDPHGNR